MTHADSWVLQMAGGRWQYWACSRSAILLSLHLHFKILSPDRRETMQCPYKMEMRMLSLCVTLPSGGYRGGHAIEISTRTQYQRHPNVHAALIFPAAQESVVTIQPYFSLAKHNSKTKQKSFHLGDWQLNTMLDPSNFCQMPCVATQEFVGCASEPPKLQQKNPLSPHTIREWVNWDEVSANWHNSSRKPAATCFPCTFCTITICDYCLEMFNGMESRWKGPVRD